MNENEDVDLSREFQEALERLPRVVEPSRGFESRLLRALRARGLLVADGPRHARTLVTTALRMAAAVVLFAAGTAFGHRLGTSSAVASQAADPGAGARELTAAVQRTGSAHAAALGDLAARAASARPEETTLAREVAMSSLRATLWQMVLLDPVDPVPARLLSELDRPALGTPPPIRVTAEPLVVSF